MDDGPDQDWRDRNMHQQINLYQPVFRKQHKVFSAVTLAQMVAAVLVLLLAILGHTRWTLARMQDSAAALQQQHEHMQAQIDTLEQALRTPDTQAVDAEIEQLGSSVEQRKALLAQFDQLVLQHQHGFASHFRILAEQHVPGLWLDGVTVNAQGEIEVRGTALDEKLVPAYLHGLAKRRDLSPTAFETVAMNRTEPGQREIQFVLRNHKDETAWQGQH
jgi:Tfp pilus assembly protein PilN